MCTIKYEICMMSDNLYPAGTVIMHLNGDISELAVQDIDTLQMRRFIQDLREERTTSVHAKGELLFAWKDDVLTVGLFNNGIADYNRKEINVHQCRSKLISELETFVDDLVVYIRRYSIS